MHQRTDTCFKVGVVEVKRAVCEVKVSRLHH